MQKKFLKTAEFAREIGVHKNTIINWDNQGKLKPHHLGSNGARFYTWEQVQEVIGRKG